MTWHARTRGEFVECVDVTLARSYRPFRETLADQVDHDGRGWNMIIVAGAESQ